MTRKGRPRFASPSRGTIGVVAGLVVVGVFLRCVFPEADALHPRWFGWLVDEGRWTELAREWALFRAPEVDTAVSRIHLILAPLYQAIVAVTFEIFGVTLSSARLLSRAAGVTLLIMVAVGLRRTLHPGAWVAAVALVALHPELVYFSRVAIPEMSALTVGAAAFLLLVRPGPTRGGDILAGVLTAVALGLKGTAAPLVPVFMAIPFLVGDAEDQRPPVVRCANWAIGFGGLALVTVGGALATGRVPGSLESLGSILAFAALNTPYAMAASLPLNGDAEEVNLMLAALAPLSAMVWILSPRDSPARRLYRGALAWASMWLVLLIALEYFPERYLLHLHLSLILAVAAACSLVRGAGARLLRARIAEMSIPRRIAIGALAAAPLAVLVVPATLVALDASGLRMERVRVFIPALATVAIGAGWIALRRGVSRAFGGALIAFPWTAALIWRGMYGPAADRWWSIDAASTLGSWVVVVGAAGVVAFLAVARAERVRVGTRLSDWTLAYVAALAVVWGGTRHYPLLARPSHLVAALSADLEQRYPPDQRVGVSLVTSALIDTPFRYREVLDARPLPSPLIVSANSRAVHIEEEALADYRVVAEFVIPRFRYRGVARPMNQLAVDAWSPVQIVERGAVPAER